MNSMNLVDRGAKHFTKSILFYRENQVIKLCEWKLEMYTVNMTGFEQTDVRSLRIIRVT